MMVQTKQRNELIFLAGLLLFAAFVWFYSFGKSGSPQSIAFRTGSYQPINAEDFGSVFEMLKAAQNTEYKTSGKNIFVVTPLPVASLPEGPKGPPPMTPLGPHLPPPPPPAQLPMKFFGYGTLPSGGPRRAFLLDGEEVRIVGEGETVLNHIRIIHIGNDRIEFEDTITGQHGSNVLEAGPSA
jgi:hypothetical protein